MRRRLGGAAAATLAWALAGSASAQSAEGLDAPAEEEEAPPEGAIPEAPGDETTVETTVETTDEVHLPTPPHLSLDAARLGAFFEDEANGERDGTVVSSVFEITLGSANLGLGLWLMLDGDTFAGLDGLRAAGGALGIPFGIMALVSGIYALTAIGTAENRLARWHAALEGGLDERELGRFEGELRSQAEAGRILRGFEAATDFAMMGGGFGLMLATALANLDEMGQAYGYGFGGLFALVGLVGGLGAVLGESHAETIWNRYRDGEGPEGADEGVDLSVAPMVTEGGFGVSLSGSF